MSTAVPVPVLGPRGFVSPTDAEILAGVQEDLAAAFATGGYTPNPALNTPQGQIATTESAVISNAYDFFCSLVGLVDPAYSYGRMQDAIARIYFLTRKPALPTTVNVLCTGAVGVTIVEGSRVVQDDGTLYESTAPGVIGSDSTITIPFACVATGPQPCPAHSIVRIYQALPGWDTVDNVADGVLGQTTESRATFETRRALSVAANSLGSIPSVVGAVFNVEGVIDAYVTENNTGSPVTVKGATLPAHSLYVAAVGGTDLAVATAIWSKKAPGCNDSGNTSVVVTDTNSGFNPPYPTYTIQFERPTDLDVFFQVNLVNNSQVPSNVNALVTAAIVAAFSGSDGGARARIGDTLYASRYYAAIAALGGWVTIDSIFIGTSGPATETSIDVDINKVPALDPADITIVLE